MSRYLLGSLVIGFESGQAHYHCDDCGCDLSMNAVAGDGDGVVPVFDCDCGGYARNVSVLRT